MDDKIMAKVAAAIKLYEALENAQELAREHIQDGEDWLKNPNNIDPGRRISVMKQCVICDRIVGLTDYLLKNNNGSVYSRLYSDLEI